MPTKTSSHIVVDFILGRPSLELEIRRKMTDPYQPPEAPAMWAKEMVLEAINTASEEEQELLDQVRGNGPVVWTEVISGLANRG
jgi:hypothetical protein